MGGEGGPTRLRICLPRPPVGARKREDRQLEIGGMRHFEYHSQHAATLRQPEARGTQRCTVARTDHFQYPCEEEYFGPFQVEMILLTIGLMHWGALFNWGFFALSRGKGPDGSITNQGCALAKKK